MGFEIGAGMAETTVWAGWPWLLSVLFILMAVGLWLFLDRRQKRDARRVYRLEIINEGNVSSHYGLHAEDREDGLEMTFALRGVRLGRRVVSEPGRAVPAPAEPSPAPQAAVPAARPAAAGRPAGREQQAGRGVDAGQAKGFMMGAANALAGILSTVGVLLPPSMRGPLMGTASRIRRGQGAVRRVESLPRRVSGSKPKSFAHSPYSTPSQGTSTAPAGAGPGAATAPEAASTQGGATSAAAGEKFAVAPVGSFLEPGWVETPFVQPGQTLAVDLFIDPLRPHDAETYFFTIKSRSLEQPEGPVVTEEGSIQIIGSTFFERYSPFLIALGFAALAIGLSMFLFSL